LVLVNGEAKLKSRVSASTVQAERCFGVEGSEAKWIVYQCVEFRSGEALDGRQLPGHTGARRESRRSSPELYQIPASVCVAPAADIKFPSTPVAQPDRKPVSFRRAGGTLATIIEDYWLFEAIAKRAPLWNFNYNRTLSQKRKRDSNRIIRCQTTDLEDFLVRFESSLRLPAENLSHLH